MGAKACITFGIANAKISTGQLKAVSEGYDLTEFPEDMEFELTTEDFVEEFGGVLDFDAFMEGLNEVLRTIDRVRCHDTRSCSRTCCSSSQ